MKDIIKKIYDYSLEELMGERFGRYSKYIIQDRAIPDVRDGLKPVQRRILYSMYKEKNSYDKPYRKSARAVGDVMGKYHPHGDSSIYEAMVRMSQEWKVRKTFVDMHGNNGSIDGDSPAAMRYTEARLSKIAGELLKDIDKNTVVFAPNYDDSLLEPTVLPAKYPNLLVNGTTGISAGYATNIPPHNLGEVIDATIHRIDTPNSRLDTIINIIKGPDFPTGGILEGVKGIEEAYKSGKGRVIIKSKTNIQNSKGKEQIIITELPYEVNKATLVRQIDEIRINKKINGILEVRDESDREGLRVVIEVKKNCDSEMILNYLLKNTNLQVSYNFNIIAIVNRRPKLLGLLDILDAYIEHQKEVVTKRSEFDLEHAKARFHIVEGLIKAVSILDDVIATIRASKNKSDAQNNLVKEYDFTNIQAEAIVLLQLYRLTNTDITSLENELKNLNIIIKGLKLILSDESKLLSVIKDELRKIKSEYNTPRLTEIKEEISEIKIDTTLMVQKEDVIVVVTNDGYVKRVSNRSYQASNEEETLLKENDYVIGFYEMNTLDTLLIFTDLGNYLYIPVHELPDMKWKELGKHISNIITIKPEENVVCSMPVNDFDSDIDITIFTKLGMIKRTKLSEYKANRYSKPLINIKLKTNDKVSDVSYLKKQDVILITNNGYGIRFDINEVTNTGIRSGGIKAINLKNDFVVSGLLVDSTDENITIITDKGTGKRVKLKELEKGNRARKGTLMIREVKTNPHKVISALLINTRDYLGIKTKNKITRIKNSELSIMDKNSTGSNISKNNILEAFKVEKLSKIDDINNTNETPEQSVNKGIELDEIDKKILTIDDFLKDIDSK